MAHFLYKRKVNKPVANPDPESKEQQYEEIEITESFNLNKVIRSVMKDTETLTVLLDDGHEESLDIVPEHRDAKGKKVEAVKKRLFLASEIDLRGEYITKFFDAITNIS